MKRVSRTKDSLTIDFERFGPAPRDVRLTANGWALVVVALTLVAAALAGALGLPVLRASQLSERDRAVRETVWTDAVIAHVKIDKGEHSRRTVTYRYTAPDGEHQNTARVSKDDDIDAVVGGRLTIAYVRSQPSRSWLEGGEPGVLPLWLVPVIPLAFLMCGAALSLAVRRERMLLSEGRFATARVTASTKVKQSHGHGYQVSYEFRTLSGAKVTGTKNRNRPVATGTDTVTVVYHRENPRWNAVYPLALTRPAHQ